MITACYIRVSTDQQDTDSQLRACVDYMLKLNWPDKPTMYMDKGISGSTLDRPAVQQLLSDIRAKKIKRLVIFEMSRLSRDMLTTGLLMQELCQLGIELHVVADGGKQNMFGAINQFIGLTKGLTAQIERERIVERTKTGLLAARQRGKRLGPPKGNQNRKGKKQQYDAALVSKVVELRALNLSITEIAKILGYNYSKIQRILRSIK